MSETGSRIVVSANPDPESQYVKRQLELMYARWDGTLDHEAGWHRFIFYSQLDEQCRRHTIFASVAVDGECPDTEARSYILGPYLLVRDHRTGRESKDPWKVLHGDLTPILPAEASE